MGFVYKLLLIHSGFVLITISGGVFPFSFIALDLFLTFFEVFSNLSSFFSYFAFFLFFLWHEIIFFLNLTHVIYNFPAFIINWHY